MNLFKRFFIHFLLRRDKTRLVAVFGEAARDETCRMIAAVLSGGFRVADFETAEAYQKIAEFYGGDFGLFLKFLGFKGKLDILVLSGNPTEAAYKELKKNLGIYLAVVTPLSDIPWNTDLFASELEKGASILKEVRTFPNSLFLVLNYDDETVREIDEKTNIRRYTYGLSKYADIAVEESDARLGVYKAGEPGIYGKVLMEGSVVPFSIPNVLGKRHIYAALAAVGVAERFEMNIVEALGRMKLYMPERGSGVITPATKGAILIDASTGSSPYFIREIIDFISHVLEMPDRSMRGRVHIALGEIVGTGGDVIALHEALGEAIGVVADFVYLVGERTKFTQESVNAIAQAKVAIYDDARKAGQAIEKELKAGDIVAVFGTDMEPMTAAIEEITETVAS